MNIANLNHIDIINYLINKNILIGLYMMIMI